MNRILSLLASLAALVTGLANPGSAVPSRVQPYLVTAGAFLLGVERVIVYLESKPNPTDAVIDAFERVIGAAVPSKQTPPVAPVVTTPTPVAPVVPPTGT